MVTDEQKSVAADAVPLVVDLDGTLVKSDLLVEATFAYMGRDLRATGAIVRSLMVGKAALKDMLASRIPVAAGLLPYDEAVLALIDEARAAGRPVFLATASHRTKAEAVAAHLGVFDGVFASTKTYNLLGAKKARALVEAFGRGGFDYVGNDTPDLLIWREARRAFSVRASAGLARKARQTGLALQPIESRGVPQFRVWLRALRVHQYAKNTLIFVPLLTAHRFTLEAFFASFCALLTFSAAASAVYLLNDLTDLEADRRHPTKCRRPFASGDLSLKTGLVVMVGLFAAALLGGFLISATYLAVLFAYIALTTAYSLFFKRKLLADVIVLAILYTTRIIAGAVAIDVVVSEWLLTFSLFVFTSLALVKRYTELASGKDMGLADSNKRNYRQADLVVVGGLAAAAAMNSVTIFTLFLSSPSVSAAYSRPKILWLISPILIYTLGRMLVLAHRREMNDDPVLFALRDRMCRYAVVAMGLLVLAAL